MERQIVYRGLRTPDGTLIETKYGHDFQVHTDKNGEWYMIDGGPNKYGRGSVNVVPGEDIILFLDDAHEKIREYVKHSYNHEPNKVFGRNEWILLKNLTNEQLTDAIDQGRRVSWVLALLLQERQYRIDKAL